MYRPAVLVAIGFATFTSNSYTCVLRIKLTELNVYRTAATIDDSISEIINLLIKKGAPITRAVAVF